MKTSVARSGREPTAEGLPRELREFVGDDLLLLRVVLERGVTTVVAEPFAHPGG